MGDPYAPKGWPRGNPEVRTELETFSDRLRQLGATDDEVAQVVAGWDTFDADWTPARRHQVVHLSDADLRQLLVDGREEYEHDTTTEEVAAVRDAERARRMAEAEAARRIGGNVDSVLAWVGDDRYRAQAVLELEVAGQRRKTLLAPMRDLVA